ncbi:hypothetical protein PILCRDRAFT_13117 [Piloderma croceum F 1598]|uniref:Uncharacterized protein n=1 Tax=Piloderma croceum (strain F 1598) TaxID=765440 RepID=A0A0C3APR3_PILCF|nr:hypothetical protein PILCRDRAFT_13117 [Piloderma croceum F 1598]
MAEAIAAGLTVAAVKGGVQLIRTPATKLTQTKANADYAHKLVSRNTQGMPEAICQKIFTDFRLLTAEVDRRKAAGDKQLKNIYKVSAWRTSKELEKRSRKLLADATTSSQQAAEERAKAYYKGLAAETIPEEFTPDATTGEHLPDEHQPSTRNIAIQTLPSSKLPLGQEQEQSEVSTSSTRTMQFNDVACSGE